MTTVRVDALSLRERIAEALTVRDGATYAAVRCPDLRLVDAVMVEVQRDLDELEARVERKMARLRQAGEVIDAAEADAARLAEALDEARKFLWGYLRGEAGLPFDEPYEACRNAMETLDAALAAHRERENQTNDGGTYV